MKAKLLLSALTLVLALAGAAFGQNGAAGKAPKLVIAATEFNVGEIKKGAEAKHTFVFKNEGAADLEIKSVAPS